MTTTADQLAAAQRTLEQRGQSHLLTYFDQLDADAQANLLAQIRAINFDEVDRLIDTYVKSKPTFELPDNLEPAPFYPMHPADDQLEQYAEARATGEQLLRDGKVAAMVVAGGSGTRLGWDGPKGTFPATPIHGKPLFQVFAESIIKAGRKYGAPLP